MATDIIARAIGQSAKDKTDKITVNNNINLDIVSSTLAESAQEIIDARGGKSSLGANISDIKEKAFQATIKNIFNGGDFKGGNYTWRAAGMTNIDYSKEGFIVADVTTRFGIRDYYDFKKGHKYYVSFYHRHNSDIDRPITFRLYPPGNPFEYVKSPLNVVFPSIPKDVAEKQETILAVDDNYDKFEIGSYPNEGYRVEIGYVLIVDLTTEFGLGNEPTIEEFAKISPHWFDDYDVVRGLQNKTLLIENREMKKDIEKVNQDIEVINSYVEVFDENDIFKLDMSVNRNFAIKLSGTNDKHVSFRNINKITDNMVSKVIKIDSETTARLTFPPNVYWKEEEVPQFFTGGNSYMVLFQSYDRGLTWFGSIVGYWKTSRIVVFDDFNRPDAPTLGNAPTGQTWHYSPTSVWGVYNHMACVYEPRTDDNLMRSDLAYIDSGVSDCLVSVDLMNDETQQNRLAVRIKDDNNFIQIGRIILRNDTQYTQYVMVSETINGNTINRQTQKVKEAFAVGDRLSAKLIGDTIEVYYNDVLYLTRNITFNKSETKHGIVSHETTKTRFFDNFLIEVV